MARGETGRGGGVSGVLDLPNDVNTARTGTKIHVKVNAWGKKLATQSKDRHGRGDTVKWRQTRRTMASGHIVVVGTILNVLPPLPDVYCNVVGTLTFTMNESRSVDYPVRVEAVDIQPEDKSEGLWSATFSLEITGAPTFSAGWGTQPVAAEPTKADKELWEGSLKTKCASGLTDRGVTTIDVWGSLSNTSAAEEGRIATVVAAATAPIAGLVVRDSTFHRTDDEGGVVVIQWGLRTHKDDIELGGSSYSRDPISVTKDVAATVISGTFSTDALRIAAADAAYAAVKTDKSVERVTITALTPGAAVRRIQRTNADGIEVPGGGGTFDDSYIISSAGGWNAQDAVVRVTRLPGIFVAPLPGGYTSGLIGHRVRRRTKETFSFMRRFSIDDSQVEAKRYRALRGTVNDATFLDRPAHSVMYSRSAVHRCVSVTGQKLVIIQYLFLEDSHEHITDAEASYGFVPCLPFTYLQSVGLYSAALTFQGVWTIPWPTQANFSVFLP